MSHNPMTAAWTILEYQMTTYKPGEGTIGDEQSTPEAATMYLSIYYLKSISGALWQIAASLENQG